MNGVSENKERKEGPVLTPLFFLEAYLPPVAEYMCLLRVGTGMISLAVQGEAPDRPLRSRCLVHESPVCSYFPLIEAMYLE